MRVRCKVAEIELENDRGNLQDGISVECSRCDHEVTAFGTSPRSVRRCLAVLREECPLNEENFYVADGSDDE